MKKILFDLIPTQYKSPSTFHGGGEYAKEVCKHLLQKKTDQDIAFFYDSRYSLCPSIDRIVKDSGCITIRLDHENNLQEILDKNNFDIFYTALFLKSYLNINFGSTKFALTIHGLRPIEMPYDSMQIYYASSLKDICRFFYKVICAKHDIQEKIKLYSLLYRKVDCIIVPSEQTKNALLSLSLPSEKINVLYSPRKQFCVYTTDESGFIHKIGLKKKDYLLIISTGRWLKNAYRAIKAIDELYTMNAKIPSKTLLLGVTTSFSKRIKNKIKNKEKFILHGYVDDLDLEFCYRDAALFIYPTLNEGFGYPPLEAMKYGTPTIASAISSVPEICQDAVMYFNPFSVQEIKNRIIQCFYNPRILHDLATKGIIHAENIAVKQEKALDDLCNIILY